jgi:hypothetical protein
MTASPIRDKYDDAVGREKYVRWKTLGGARPQWVDNALRNGGVNLTGWEVSFMEALRADIDQQDRQKGPPIKDDRPEPTKGGKSHPHPSRPPQGELPLGGPPRGDEQPLVPPLPVQRAEDIVLPDE